LLRPRPPIDIIFANDYDVAEIMTRHWSRYHTTRPFAFISISGVSSLHPKPAVLSSPCGRRRNGHSLPRALTDRLQISLARTWLALSDRASRSLRRESVIASVAPVPLRSDWAQQRNCPIAIGTHLSSGLSISCRYIVIARGLVLLSSTHIISLNEPEYGPRLSQL
jgi:hypothetical protein